ncbi:reverse transcriptase/maturase family protein [Clostridium formicaceticum]|uniref:Group II intron-encoded protein LtrA n=1 Tax=Clostridium formicaceticum TaxID=1497 RepID=A0AAC9WGG5_9CLOT|nr:reverse transcriptase/maturase family protein [Clostridium formicaceticum]AOY77257.1 hypothetical protein BJL90_16220 [Clostridium formicaceticum]ARE87794.1 Group II intron-encoded protein LtrA [Clostridium formicaceticum]
MRNPDKVLEVLRNNSIKEGYRFEDLYRNLYNQEFYLKAYEKIYAKEGNMTAETDNQTIDGFGVHIVEKLINSLKDESYQPKPARRVYVPKQNSKKLRPLGIPAIYDKILQEIIRMILESIYEPTFSDNSHSFRPRRSCHTALLQIKHNFTATKWWIEGDIEGFFDNIDHAIMVEILKKKIKDEKFIRLIWKFLKAGYIEDFKLYQTYSGTPQGGIVSPILANIYLNELDIYMEEYIRKFDKGNKRKENRQYKNISNKIHLKRRLLKEQPDEKIQKAKKEIEEAYEEIKQYCALHPEIKNFNNDDTVRRLRGCIYKRNLVLRKPSEEERSKLISEIKELSKELKTLKTYEQMDEDHRRMKYVRYADDFLIGIIGTKEDAEKVKEELKSFLNNKLKLTLSQEKTLITHNSEKARFLGYDVFVNTNEDLLIKRNFQGRKEVAKTGVNSIKLSLPHDKLVNFMMKNGYIKEDDKVWKPVHRAKFRHNDDLEIVTAYNQEFRGFYNYYKFAFDVASKLSNAHFVFKNSFTKTLGNKYACKTSKLMGKKTEKGNKKYFREGEWGITWVNKDRQECFVPLFKREEIKFCKKIFEEDNDAVDIKPNTNFGGRNGLIKRLLANKCEWCGDMTGPFEVHHVKKLKDLKGKKTWEKLMIARKRKTLVLCTKGSTNNCHLRLHKGELD